jgi:solute carrier family 25 (mitochondrial S-adenosylmethionine transporter), member 26
MGEDERPLDLTGLYSGILSNILKEAPNAAIYLGVYELLKNFLLSTTAFHDLPLLVFIVAGALGDAIGSLVRCPAEIVNKRLQLGVNPDALSAVREAFLTPHGRQSSFVAWEAVLWRDVPYGGMQIALYEFGKQFILTHPDALALRPGIFADVITGAVAGTIAAMLTTPADVLVTRLSVQNPQSYLETRRYMGVASTLRRIVREEGPSAMFSGVLQRGLYYAPLIGLFFALYETTRVFVADPHAVVIALHDRLGSFSHFLHDAVFASTQAISHLVPVLVTVAVVTAS